MKIDIEIYEEGKEQAKFLVHGYDDVFWTNDLSDAVLIITEELRKAAKEPIKMPGYGFCSGCGERCDYC